MVINLRDLILSIVILTMVAISALDRKDYKNELVVYRIEFIDSLNKISSSVSSIDSRLGKIEEKMVNELESIK